jgi:hypothetical protein
VADLTRLGDAGTPEPSRVEGGGGDRLRDAYPRRLPLHLDPERARSCPRREHHEPHLGHAWLPELGLGQRQAWCHGVGQAPATEKLCYQPGGQPHPPHGWMELNPESEPPTPVARQCPGVPPDWMVGGLRAFRGKAPPGPESDEPLPLEPRVYPFGSAPVTAGSAPLDASFRNPPEAERVTASHAWQGDGNVLDDLTAYRDAGYPGLTSEAHRVDLAPSVADNIRTMLAKRPILMVHDQATADAIHADHRLPGLLRVVVDEHVPAGRVYLIDPAKLAVALEDPGDPALRSDDPPFTSRYRPPVLVHRADADQLLRDAIAIITTSGP